MGVDVDQVYKKGLLVQPLVFELFGWVVSGV